MKRTLPATSETFSVTVLKATGVECIGRTAAEAEREATNTVEIVVRNIFYFMTFLKPRT